MTDLQSPSGGAHAVTGAATADDDYPYDRTALRAELLEVLERYRRVGQGNPAAKRVVVYTCALPVDRHA